jgi:hypothetical protein
LSVTVLTLGATGCGKNGGGILASPAVHLRTVNDQSWVDFTGVLKTGNVSLPSVQFPVRHRGEEVGSLALVSGFGGGTQVTLAVNVSRLARLPASTDATLPNRTGIPLVGVENFRTYKLNVGNERSVAYLGLGNDAAFLGYSLVIREMDGVGRSVGTTTVFVPFEAAGIKFTAGAFTSATPLESGLGAFADISALMRGVVGIQPTVGVTLAARTADGVPVPAGKVNFVAPRSRTLDRVRSELYQLQRRPFRATVQ